MARDVIRSILVASDLSRSSDPVVRAAAELADQTGAELHVLHAIEILGNPFWEATFDLVRLQSVIHEARTRLHDQLRRVLPSGVNAGSVQLDYQAAHAAILQRAKEVRADLLVIGPHRARMPGSHMLGTTAQRVVEEAAMPCLVTRGPLPFPLRRILVPVGEPDVQRGLLATVGEWIARVRSQQELRKATEGSTELRVLHVVRSSPDWRAFSPEIAREIRALGDHPWVAGRLRLHRAIAWSRTPAEEIVRMADDASVDLIGMGVRGHGPLLRALLGSVSSAVLRRASAPVLLFPPRMCERWRSGPEAASIGTPGRATSVPSRELVVEVRDADAEWHLSYLDSDPDEDGIEVAGAKLTR